MRREVYNYIYSNKDLKRYLSTHSYYYKFILRDSNFVYTLNELMKKEYKLTLSDKLEKFNDSLNLIENILSNFK